MLNAYSYARKPTFEMPRTPRFRSVKFAIDTSLVSIQTVSDYLDFLRIVYDCPVKIRRVPHAETGEVITLYRHDAHEYGLRVAAWLYNIPYYHEALATLPLPPHVEE